ncbi:MAG TPA: flagellar biosynthesis regulator FlaF [Methylocella sp.]|nr:flagellar biosynthesis regulator FlaF [Methylocella sp.]
MYEFYYNEVAEESPQMMRERERRAFDKVITLLKSARETGVNSREAIEALFWLRKLWFILLDDLQSPGNELPADLRAGIVSIGLWMMREMDELSERNKTDLMPIIEINEIIRDGLI